MRRFVLLLALAAVAAGTPLTPASAAEISADRVVVPMVFPVVGKVSYSDTFLACRSGCARQHLGQDLMGAKMTPLVATFDGVISTLRRESTGSSGNYVSLRGDNGWSTNYLHMNNDTPGTDDAKGTAYYAFAPGLEQGVRVFAGQLLGWLGDSGNAEGTGPHLHFELRKGEPWSGVVYNAKPSLDAAARRTAPTVSGPHPDGSLIQDGFAGPVYVVEDGAKHPVTPAVMAANGWNPAQVLHVSRQEVAWHRTSWWEPPRDGTLVKAPSGEVSLVLDNRRIRLTEADLAALGKPAARTWPLSDGELARIPYAADQTVPGPWHEGAVVRFEGSATIWHVDDGVRRRLPDWPTLGSHGYNASDVAVVPAETPVPVPVDPAPESALGDGTDPERPGATIPPAGPDQVLRDGTLALAPTGALAVVGGGTARHVPNMLALKLFAYEGKRPYNVWPETLNRLPRGPFVDRAY